MKIQELIIALFTQELAHLTAQQTAEGIVRHSVVVQELAKMIKEVNEAGLAKITGEDIDIFITRHQLNIKFEESLE